MGIEPTRPAWKAGVLPLNYTRMYRGREDRIRTCDPLVPSQVLYQAELLPDTNPLNEASLLVERDDFKQMACPERFELPTF